MQSSRSSRSENDFRPVRDAVEKGETVSLAAQRVISRRVAMGIDAMARPIDADYAEFHRMVTEKVEAFTTAHDVLMRQSVAMTSALAKLAFDEATATARGWTSLAFAANPLVLWTSQGRFLAETAERLVALTNRTTELGLSTGEAVVAPVFDRVMENDRRLS